MLSTRWNMCTIKNSESVHSSLIFDCISFAVVSNVAVLAYNKIILLQILQKTWTFNFAFSNGKIRYQIKRYNLPIRLLPALDSSIIITPSSYNKIETFWVDGIFICINYVIFINSYEGGHSDWKFFLPVLQHDQTFPHFLGWNAALQWFLQGLHHLEILDWWMLEIVVGYWPGCVVVYLRLRPPLQRLPS